MVRGKLEEVEYLSALAMGDWSKAGKILALAGGTESYGRASELHFNVPCTILQFLVCKAKVPCMQGDPGFSNGSAELQETRRL